MMRENDFKQTIFLPPQSSPAALDGEKLSVQEPETQVNKLESVSCAIEDLLIH